MPDVVEDERQARGVPPRIRTLICWSATGRRAEGRASAKRFQRVSIASAFLAQSGL